ncbi:MAG: galactokinase [Bacillota bacterium]|nr:MAG: galactokinase [Bacillota bacterium]
MENGPGVSASGTAGPQAAGALNAAQSAETLADRVRTLQDEFRRRFPYDARVHGTDAAPVVVRSPGRVNLIGEHTDYNDGFVLPLAIDREILLTGRRRTDGRVRVYSLNFGQEASFHLNDLRGLRPGGDAAPAGRDAPWSDYVRGVVWALLDAGFEPGGFDMALAGNIPVGAGLSSSAALEVGTAVLLRELYRLELDSVQMAKLCQRAENDFVGVQCGIMDQFTVALGRQGHGLLLDTRTLEYRYVPIPTQNVRLVVADTGVGRQLASSAYNQRRAECETAVELLRRRLPDIRALRDVPPHRFEQHRHELADVIARRAAHVIYENARVQATADALANDNFTACGRLMHASHVSLRDNFEVSSPELDEMVAIAEGVPGVYGARMTGAGFGGCTVSLVRADAVPDLVKAIADQYPRRTGKTPAVYVVTPSDGAARLI